MQPMSLWTVLAPGPSLARLKLEHLQQAGTGHVVAINNARFKTGVPMDAWLCLDIPKKFEQVYTTLTPEQRYCGPIVWTGRKNAAEWRDLGFRTWEYPDSYDEFKLQLPWGAGSEYPWQNLTMTGVMALCVAKGAKHIRFFGCDLEGVGYFQGVDVCNRDPVSWASRWQTEKSKFTSAKKELEQHGIVVEASPVPGG